MEPKHDEESMDEAESSGGRFAGGVQILHQSLPPLFCLKGCDFRPKPGFFFSQAETLVEILVG
jgi:hypothetical protein